MYASKNLLLAAIATVCISTTSAFVPALSTIALRPTGVSNVCATRPARLGLRMADDDGELPEECLLVMKPCDSDITLNDEECLDEDALQACQSASEEQLMAKMAKLHKEDETEEMLQDGSF